LLAIWNWPRAKQSYWDQDLKQWNLLEEKCSNFSFRSHQQLVSLLRKEVDLVFCYDVDGLMNARGIKYDPQEWLVTV
jgi:hypothetical protein